MTPADRLRSAVFQAMEEAELFGDMTRAERDEAVRLVNTLPNPIVANVGRAFQRAAREIAA